MPLPEAPRPAIVAVAPWRHLLAAAALPAVLALALMSPVAGAAPAAPVAAPTLAVDLPTCERSAPGKASGWSLGLVQPGASDDVLHYALRLTLQRDDLEACQESWRSVLPRFTPLAQQLERGHGLALYALAFVLVVIGLRVFTPRAWWRRTRALGLIALAGLTWGLGTLLLAGFHAAQGQRLVYSTVVSLRAPQEATPRWHNIHDARELEALLAQLGIDTRLSTQAPVPAAAAPGDSAPATATSASAPAAPIGTQQAATLSVPAPAEGRYRVAHRLNLRQGPGTQHEWIATLDRGDTVLVTGSPQGDWWPLQTASGQKGWASSLWLRRPTEALPRLDGGQRG